MSVQTTQNTTKLQKFLDELKALCDFYQYKLTPKLQFNENGVTPYLGVDEVVPERPEQPEYLAEKPAKRGKK